MFSERVIKFQFPMGIYNLCMFKLKQLLKLLSAVCFLIVVPVLLAEGGLEVESLTPSLRETAPGHIITLSFRVTDLSDREKETEFLEEIQLPDGWRNIIPMDTFRLTPRERTSRMVAFHVPGDARAGGYEIIYSVTSEREYALTDSATARVEVLPIKKMEFLLEEAPERVIAGQKYQIKTHLINSGNASLKVNLRVESAAGYPAAISPQKLDLLNPGQSVPIKITVNSDPAEKRPYTHRVMLIAEAQEINDKKVIAQKRIGVDIIPRVTGEPMEIMYPVRFSTILAREKDSREAESNFGFQFELEGDGYLDEEKTRRLDFLFRGPDMRDEGIRGIFGQRDEYGAGYTTPDFSLQLGDRHYSLSPLSSWRRYGRGLGFFFLRKKEL